MFIDICIRIHSFVQPVQNRKVQRKTVLAKISLITDVRKWLYIDNNLDILDKFDAMHDFHTKVSVDFFGKSIVIEVESC